MLKKVFYIFSFLGHLIFHQTWLILFLKFVHFQNHLAEYQEAFIIQN